MEVKKIRYTVHNIEFDDTILRDLGDDFMFLRFDLEIEKQWYWQSVPFIELWEFAKSKKLPEGRYFDTVRKNLKGYGPKHSVMFSKFLEEGFDMMPLLHAYLDECLAEDGMESLKHRKIDGNKISTPEEIAAHKALKKKAAELKEMAGRQKSNNLRHTMLEDNILDYVNQEVLRLFPELFNSKPSIILELENIYHYHIRELALKIVNLAYKAEQDRESD